MRSFARKTLNCFPPSLLCEDAIRLTEVDSGRLAAPIEVDAKGYSSHEQFGLDLVGQDAEPEWGLVVTSEVEATEQLAVRFAF